MSSRTQKLLLASAILAAGSGGGGGGGGSFTPVEPSAQVWRFFIPRHLNGSFPRIGAIKTFDKNDVRLDGSGTATASTGTAANAFDDDLTLVWEGNANFGIGQWVEYDFGLPVAVAKVTLQAPSVSATGMPASLIAEYKDGNGDYIGYFAGDLGAAWATSEEKTFAFADKVPVRAARYVRLKTLGSPQGENNAIYEWRMMESLGGADVIPSQTLTASNDAVGAVANITDDNIGTAWANSFGGPIHWVKADAGVGNDITPDRCIVYFGSVTTTIPYGLQVEISDDDTDYDVVGWYLNSAGHKTQSWHPFVLSDPPASYGATDLPNQAVLAFRKGDLNITTFVDDVGDQAMDGTLAEIVGDLGGSTSTGIDMGDVTSDESNHLKLFGFVGGVDYIIRFREDTNAPSTGFVILGEDGNQFAGVCEPPTDNQSHKSPGVACDDVIVRDGLAAETNLGNPTRTELWNELDLDFGSPSSKTVIIENVEAETGSEMRPLWYALSNFLGDFYIESIVLVARRPDIDPQDEIAQAIAYAEAA